MFGNKEKIKYIDIHAHLYFDNFDKEKEQVIERIKKNKIGVINIATNLRNSIETIDLATQEKNFYATVGVHPTDLEEVNLEILKSEILNLAKNPKVVSIGECGLDYFRVEKNIKEFKEKQKKCFEIQVEATIESDLPIMIHCRDAYEEVLKILETYHKRTLNQNDPYYGKRLRGNFHFFAGSMNILERILKLGFHVSYTGVITFAPQYQELIEKTPLDRLHAETDSPFVAPVPFRGQRNEPTYVLEVIKKMSEIKGQSFNKFSKQLMKNAQNLFGIN